MGRSPAAIGRVSASESELLEVARAAAQAAAAELLARYDAAPQQLATKTTPTDLVSAADLAAEQAIRALLARERPGDAILGEEGGATAATGASGVRWVVDPLDGTVNYLFGHPQWSVSVACEDADGALAGVVLDPLRGEEHAATRSGPAPARPRRPDVTLATALVATGFAYDAGVRAQQAAVLARVLPRVRDIRRDGSAALDLAWLAAGRFDAYWERGVQPWDVAAGLLLCERAGLDVHALAATAHEPAGVLVGPPALAAELLALVVPSSPT